jgi:hypothetical protein
MVAASAAESPGSVPAPLVTVVERLERRRIPLVLVVLGLVLGMVYTLFWGPVVRHTSAWITPGDFWATYRAAHFVGWGDLGGVYGAHAGIVTFPGILVLLAPVAMLTGSLGLLESYPFVIPHPTAWLVCGPIEMLLGSVALFGVDALGERLGLSTAKRAIVVAFVAVGLWNTVVLWGHPEDAIAVGLACYALVAVVDRKRAAAGWLFGAAIVMQPLVLLILPLAVVSIGARSSWSMIWRCIFVPTALLLAPLTASFSATTRALVDQPNFPNLDHRTPWTNLAPALGGSGKYLEVAGGPVRLLSVFGACLLAVLLRKRLADPNVLVWACSGALLIRCATESVMVAYYLWPATVFAVVLVVQRRFTLLLAGISTGLFLVVFSDLRLGEWQWWSPTIGASIALVVVAYPRLKSAPVRDDQTEVVHTGASTNAEPAHLQQRRAPALVTAE